MIDYRMMTASDITQIAQLETLSFSDPWSEKSIASELENPLSCWIVACDEARVVGYVGSQTVIDETDMMNLAVHPDYRRSGIAGKLVEKLIASLMLRQSRCLTLEVRASNDPARSLYEKLGFCQIGLRKNYYRNPKEDAIILRKEWEL